jgi:hypothetical protein
VALGEGQIDTAAELFAEALAYADETGTLSTARTVVDGLAAVAAAMGDGPRAARLAAAAEHTPRGHAAITATEEALVARHLGAARARTDPAEWEDAWRHGTALSLQEATAEILAATAARGAGHEVSPG